MNPNLIVILFLSLGLVIASLIVMRERRRRFGLQTLLHRVLQGDLDHEADEQAK